MHLELGGIPLSRWGTVGWELRHCYECENPQNYKLGPSKVTKSFIYSGQRYDKVRLQVHVDKNYDSRAIY